MVPVKAGLRWLSVLLSGIVRTVHAGVLLFGLGLLITGIVVGVETRDFLQKAVPAEGRIARFDSGSRTWYPVVEFKDRDGKVLRFTSKTGFRAGEQQVGAVVSVLYDPADDTPTRAARLAGKAWNYPFTLGLMGFVILGMYLGSWISTRFKARRNVQP
jgi:hypothetical protein